MANFRMAYALEKLNGTVLAQGKLYTGKDVKNFYDSFYNQTIARNEPANGDAVQYTLMRITEQYGWEPIKEAMAELSSAEYGGTNYEKFIRFVNTIEKYAPGAKDTYTQNELNLIRTGLN